MKFTLISRSFTHEVNFFSDRSEHQYSVWDMEFKTREGNFFEKAESMQPEGSLVEVTMTGNVISHFTSGHGFRNVHKAKNSG